MNDDMMQINSGKFTCFNCKETFENSIYATIFVFSSIDFLGNNVKALSHNPEPIVVCIGCAEKGIAVHLDNNGNMVCSMGKLGRLYKLMKEKEDEIGSY